MFSISAARSISPKPFSTLSNPRSSRLACRGVESPRTPSALFYFSRVSLSAGICERHPYLLFGPFHPTGSQRGYLRSMPNTVDARQQMVEICAAGQKDVAGGKQKACGISHIRHRMRRVEFRFPESDDGFSVRVRQAASLRAVTRTGRTPTPRLSCDQ